MRVLLVAFPMVGDVLPMVPVATALQTAGHDVVVATGGDELSAVSTSGLEAQDVAPGVDIAALFGNARAPASVKARRPAQGEERKPDLGAGLAVPAERITAADLERLVGDPALARAAREVAEEIAAMPHPDERVPELVALVR